MSTSGFSAAILAVVATLALQSGSSIGSFLSRPPRPVAVEVKTAGCDCSAVLRESLQYRDVADLWCGAFFLVIGDVLHYTQYDLHYSQYARPLKALEKDSTRFVCSPDFELVAVDLSTFQIRAVRRAPAFPRDAGRTYAFDAPPDTPAMAAARVEARHIAELPGVVPAPGSGGAEEDGGTWRFADPGSLGFAEEVAPEVFADAAKVKNKGSSALNNVGASDGRRDFALSDEGTGELGRHRGRHDRVQSEVRRSQVQVVRVREGDFVLIAGSCAVVCCISFDSLVSFEQSFELHCRQFAGWRLHLWGEGGRGRGRGRGAGAGGEGTGHA